jgi:predicted ABC-type ATPase
MNLAAAIELYSGGPGSGCNPAVGNCGRKSAGSEGVSFKNIQAPTKPLGPGQSTEDVWRDPKTGKWDPERAAFHERVVSALIAGHARYAGQPIATILGGGTASGKTSASRKIMGDDPNVIRVDPDELKLAIPEYAGLKQTDPEHASLRVHEESSYISKLAMAQIAARGLDLVYDATTSGNGGPSMAQLLQSKGYDVRAMFFDIPVEEAVARSERRANKSDDPINFGRHVPLAVIQANHYGAANKFMKMKDMPEITSKKFFDNTGSEPKLVYERAGMGEEKIHDNERWEQYKAKAEGHEST